MANALAHHPIVKLIDLLDLACGVGGEAGTGVAGSVFFSDLLWLEPTLLLTLFIPVFDFQRSEWGGLSSLNFFGRCSSCLVHAWAGLRTAVIKAGEI